MAREQKKDKIARSIRIIENLITTQPEARCTLDFETDWQLLFAAILASQCTDERVNIITAEMFSKWPKLDDYPDISFDEMAKTIQSCGLYNMKAKAIIKSSKILIEDYGGKVPNDERALLKFPGVGQKITNLLLGELFGKPAMVVDTHNGRISRLLGFTKEKQAKKVEEDLIKIVPRQYWIVWGHHMVELGRNECKARCRQCGICPIGHDCAYALSNKESIDKILLEGNRDACC